MWTKEQYATLALQVSGALVAVGMIDLYVIPLLSTGWIGEDDHEKMSLDTKEVRKKLGTFLMIVKIVVILALFVAHKVAPYDFKNVISKTGVSLIIFAVVYFAYAYISQKALWDAKEKPDDQ